MNHFKSLSDSEIIDLPSVLERIGGDETFLEELLKIYFEEGQSKLSELERALAKGDFAVIQEISHSLKGSSANLSLLELQKIASALETAGRQADREKAQENLAKLKRAFEKLLAHLSQFDWWHKMP